jgi:hypothetical protein
MNAYFALAGIVLSVLTGFVCYQRGESAAELVCQQGKDQAAVTAATAANEIQQQQNADADPPRTVYVETIKTLPGRTVVRDRIVRLCDDAAAAAAGGGAAVSGDGSNVHGGAAGDAGDRRGDLAGDARSCAVIKARLIGLQSQVCAKSAPEVRASARCVELLGPLR